MAFWNSLLTLIALIILFGTFWLMCESAEEYYSNRRDND